MLGGAFFWAGGGADWAESVLARPARVAQRRKWRITRPPANREGENGLTVTYSSLRVKTIGTCMCVGTSRPPLRPGLNFHLLTAATAAASNSRWEERRA